MNTTYFAYNGDLTDENGFEDHAPYLFIQALKPLLNPYRNYTLFRMMPVGLFFGDGPDTANYPGITLPQNPIEYYRYLTCSWKDGSPLTIGGTGYGNMQPTKTAFPGNPYVSGNWSEFNEQNQPGDRHALMSWLMEKSIPELLNF